MVDDSIYSRLSGFTALTNLVGSNIWAVEVPSDSVPVEQAEWAGVVFFRVSDFPDQSIDGLINLNNARFQFDCISNLDHRTARQISIQVIAALQGYRGGEILAARFIGGSMDLFEAETTREHHIPIDFHISYAA